MTCSLSRLFYETCSKYCSDRSLIEKCFSEIVKQYDASGRYYHNFLHLEALYIELGPYLSEIENTDALLMALFYHDAVYNTLRSNNEEKSAQLAQQKMHQLGFPTVDIHLCYQMILATKAHRISPNKDINLFTDADLSILGKSSEQYRDYVRYIRREYRYYPDFLYLPARKKVLQHFLKMPHIYKTVTFREKYELPARFNIAEELAAMSSQNM